MLRKIKAARPSPAMGVAFLALLVALGGTASALSGKNNVDNNDLKSNVVKGKHIVADTVQGSDVLESSLGEVPTAANANAVGGAPLSSIAPIANSTDSSCAPALAVFTDCTGVTITTTRTSDIFVNVTSQWHSDGIATTNAEGNCRIEVNEVVSTSTSVFGTSSDDTEGGNYERAVSMSDVDVDQPAGTYLYELSCSLVEGDFDLSDVETTVMASGS